MMRTLKRSLFLLLCLAFFSSCRKDEKIRKADIIQVSLPEYNSIDGFYLLNEGNMGSNKSTLDYYDAISGTYHRNIYAEINPNVVKELGDVGNDLKIYGSKMYALINCSNKIEVMDAKTAKSIARIDIPNVRYIAFSNGYAYASSYAGPVQIDPEYKQIGYVVKIDTATFQIVGHCLVGFQPEELVIVSDKIYVANSGGYMFPNYEKTISVIDLKTFSEIKKIPVALNLHRLRIDKYAQLWVSSRGNYYQNSSRLYCIDLKKDIIIDSLDIAVSDFYLSGDSLYICGVEWNNTSHTQKISYGLVDVGSRKIISRNFITDGTDQQIKIPYGIAVHPITKDIYITDAKNYVSPGELYCFDYSGKLKWKVRTGDIPAHFTFLGNLK